jgi:hypothetical protein
MPLAVTLLLFAALAATALVWTSRRAAARPPPGSVALADLETQIPYDIRITSEAPPWCDPVDLRVDFTTDASGQVIQETWTVMDRGTPQMAFTSFDDLYYRCDGPDCFRITFHQEGRETVLFVTLK